VANAAALINEGLWRKDVEFRKLPRLAQCTFCQVLSMKDLDTAGVLTLHLDLMAKACDELSVEQLHADLDELEARRFVFVDYDTDELFIRSYVRNVSVKNRNSWYSVPKNSRMVASSKIRRELAAELRRLRRKDADEIADEIDPNPTPSGPGRDGVETGSTPGTSSEPAPDGDSHVQVLVPESLNAFGSVGKEPSQFCSKHPNDTERDCFACGQARRSYPERKAKWDADVAELRAARRLNCIRCQGENTYEDEDGAVWPCGNHLLEGEAS
jgi:hypothetical protein